MDDSVNSASVQFLRCCHCSFYIAKLCTGAGVLGLPFVFQQCGILIGCMIVILCVALNSLGCHLLIASQELLERMPHRLRNTIDQTKARDTYAHIAQVTMGKMGVHIVDAAILLTLFGAAALYQVTVSSLLVQVFPDWSMAIFILICCTLLLPFIFLRDIGVLAYVSGVAVFTYIAAFIVIYVYGAQHHPFVLELKHLLPSTHISPHSVTEGFGVVCFSLGIPILCFTLYESMKNPDKFFNAIDSTLILVALAYIAIGVIGLALFGKAQPPDHEINPMLPIWHGVQPIILTNLPESVIGIVVKLLVAAVLLLTSPMTFVPGLGLLESIVFQSDFSSMDSSQEDSARLLSQKDVSEYGSIIDSEEEGRSRRGEQKTGLKHEGLDRSGGGVPEQVTVRLDLLHPAIPSATHTQRVAATLLRVSMLILVGLVAIFVPCFTLLMSLIGCITLNILSFILPPFFYIRLQHMLKEDRLMIRDYDEDGEPSIWGLVGCHLFLMFGICSMIATTWFVLVQRKCE